ncbi:MAG: radical SAM protein [Planctomycetota bacterium]
MSSGRAGSSGQRTTNDSQYDDLRGEPVHDNDTRSGHVPSDLIYGPVQSRRFGRSLGVSLSAPGVTVCHWRCPYCQLGDWPYDQTAPWPDRAEIRRQLATVLASTEAPEVITIAGGGEPTDHPAFAAISADCRELADHYGARLLLLSNGDGLDHDDRRDALRHYEDVHIKWDPGPRAGSWRPGRISREARLALLERIRPLHIQTMVFDDPQGGNIQPEHLERFRDAMRRLQPERIHLGSIDRDPRLADKRPLDPERLRQLATDLSQAIGTVVICH